ncbi:MAG: hypothetical protein ABI647_10580 [Gemmatimonadota bacterium]
MAIAEPDSLESFLPLRTQALTARGELVMETGSAILHFDPRGRLLNVMGRSGSGPGEFIRISTVIALPGDSLVAAVDARRGRIVIFALSDGTLRREVSVAPFFAVQQSRIVGDTVVMPGKLSDRPFTSWLPRSDSVWRWGEAPPIFAKSIQAYSQGGEPSIAPFEAGWVALYPADGSLYVLRHDGTPTGVIALPVRRRVGVPNDVAERVAKVAKSGRFRYAASLALGIHRLSDGRYLTIHLDADPDLNLKTFDPASGGRGITYSNVRYWVSLLSADLSRACVDGLMPASADDIILPIVGNDTVYLLARTVDPAGRLRTVLRSYSVSDAGCDWQPTGGSQPPHRTP